MRLAVLFFMLVDVDAFDSARRRGPRVTALRADDDDVCEGPDSFEAENWWLTLLLAPLKPQRDCADDDDVCEGPDSLEAENWWAALLLAPLKPQRDFDAAVRNGKRVEKKRFLRGKLIVQRQIANLVEAERQFVKDGWAREAAARAGPQALLDDEWAREERAKSNALRFLGDEWEREQAARDAARAFLIDEIERLQEADSDIATRLRGAPELTVCVAKVSCGQANGCAVADRLATLAEEGAGPTPLVRSTTTCSARCRKGHVVVTGLPRKNTAFIRAVPTDDDQAPEAPDVDGQIRKVLEKCRKTTGKDLLQF